MSVILSGGGNPAAFGQMGDNAGAHMLEAIAAAFLVGGINTIADAVTSELKLDAKPIYVFARAVLICYCVGAIVGARARQLLMGSAGGLMIGALVGMAHYLLAPAVGWAGLAVAWTLFWIGFSLLDTLLDGRTNVGLAILQGIAGAVLSGVFFYAIRNVWTEGSGADPSLLRGLVSW
jgi:hypothetical protein